MSKISNSVHQVEALFSHAGIQGFFGCRWLLTALGLFLALSCLACCEGQDKTHDQETARIEFQSDSDGTLVVIVSECKGLETKSINVWVKDANQKADPPLSGTSRLEQDQLIFQPRFPFLPGMKYVVVVESSAGSQPIRATLSLPAEGRDAGRVTHVFPSSNKLPENTLKFYIHFSEPMRKGDVYQYFRLREQGGDEIELPFLEIEQEFWSRDSKRLTLLLDPGRIKRGLKPREEMGPILSAGKSYELVINGTWPDANGNKLGKDFVKRFRALPEDHTQPNPAKWKISIPQAGTRDPLEIQFAEALDHSMLFGSIGIEDKSSNTIEGTISVTDQEQRWRFEPTTPWLAGAFKLSINSDLEDNVGNSVGRQFDVDVFEKTERSDSLPVVVRQFQIDP